MSANTPGNTYTQEHYEVWEEMHQVSAPYYDAIYPQLTPYIQDAERIADIGGGDGHSHRVLPAFSARMTTVDIDAVALGRLRATIPAAETVRANMQKLPFDDASFDAALSFNCISVMPEAMGVPKEIARILKPGGVLLFMQDVSQDMATVALNMVKGLPSGHYAVPLHNRESGNVDIFAHLNDAAIDLVEGVGSISAKLALDKVRPLLGSDWAKKIYGDPFTRATHAKMFAQLIRTMEADCGEEVVPKVGPLAPTIKAISLGNFRGRDDLEAEEVTLTADYTTEEPHMVRDRALSTLYLDELAVPQLVYRGTPSGDGTRIRGKTPLFVVRKPG